MKKTILLLPIPFQKRDLFNRCYNSTLLLLLFFLGSRERERYFTTSTSDFIRGDTGEY